MAKKRNTSGFILPHSPCWYGFAIRAPQTGDLLSPFPTIITKEISLINSACCAKIVTDSINYLYSSARDCAGTKLRYLSSSFS